MEEIDIIISKDGREFVVYSGISDKLLHQLITFSSVYDEAVQRFTGDSERFMSEEKTILWLQDNGRRVYTLVPKDDREVLAGFSWLRADEQDFTLDTVSNPELFTEYQTT